MAQQLSYQLSLAYQRPPTQLPPAQLPTQRPALLPQLNLQARCAVCPPSPARISAPTTTTFCVSARIGASDKAAGAAGAAHGGCSEWVRLMVCPRKRLRVLLMWAAQVGCLIMLLNDAVQWFCSVVLLKGAAHGGCSWSAQGGGSCGNQWVRLKGAAHGGCAWWLLRGAAQVGGSWLLLMRSCSMVRLMVAAQVVRAQRGAAQCGCSRCCSGWGLMCAAQGSGSMVKLREAAHVCCSSARLRVVAQGGG